MFPSLGRLGYIRPDNKMASANHFVRKDEESSPRRLEVCLRLPTMKDVTLVSILDT